MMVCLSQQGKVHTGIDAYLHDLYMISLILTLVTDNIILIIIMITLLLLSVEVTSVQLLLLNRNNNNDTDAKQK